MICVSESSRRRYLAALPLCLCAAGCFGGPGLEPPGGDSADGRGAPTAGGAGAFGGMGIPDGEGVGVADPAEASGAGSGGAGGGVPANFMDAGAPLDGGTGAADAGDAGPAPGCADLAEAYEAALAAAQACGAGDTCSSSYVGTGCSDGLLPLCGVAHRAGADLAVLSDLDSRYRAAGCALAAPIACADCAPPLPSTCVAGRCE